MREKRHTKQALELMDLLLDTATDLKKALLAQQRENMAALARRRFHLAGRDGLRPDGAPKLSEHDLKRVIVSSED